MTPLTPAEKLSGGTNMRTKPILISALAIATGVIGLRPGGATGACVRVSDPPVCSNACHHVCPALWTGTIPGDPSGLEVPDSDWEPMPCFSYRFVVYGPCNITPPNYVPMGCNAPTSPSQCCYRSLDDAGYPDYLVPVYFVPKGGAYPACSTPEQ